MIRIDISNGIKEVCPSFALGCLQASVIVKKSPLDLKSELSSLAASIQEQVQIEEISSLKEILASRETYKRLGKSPSRYRVSSEALYRRIVSGKGMYNVNNVVDINNLLSIQSRHSVGCYDLGSLSGNVKVSVAAEGTQYQGIGKGMLNVENLPILEDSLGCFGSPTSDSDRAMIRETTREIMLCVYGFSGREGIEETLRSGAELLRKYASAKVISISIIQ